jgi:hypothetical protein
MMTRKDYVAVSSILKEYKEVIPSEEYLELVWDFASYMKMDNERFDNSRFLEACNIPKVEYPQTKSAMSHVALA